MRNKRIHSIGTICFLVCLLINAFFDSHYIVVADAPPTTKESCEGVSTEDGSCVVEVNTADNDENGQDDDDNNKSKPTTLSSRVVEEESSSSTTATTNDKQGEKTTNKCKLYLAESTIPNSGSGVYTAINLHEGDEVGYGDVAIPLVHIETHNARSNFFFLWDDYIWQATSLGTDFENEVDHKDYISGCVFGFGAAVNCHLGLTNLEEGKAKFDDLGLHRAKDVGAGAFTTYYDRKTTANFDIDAGSELFVDYGESWFKQRTDVVGLIPMENDYENADALLEQYEILRDKHNETIVNDLEKDLYDLMTHSPYDGRTTNALPQSLDDFDEAREIGTADMLIPRSIRSLDWLEANGKCMDNIRPGQSTIRQAGRGAFATRFVPKGGLVAPGPLIHIPDRTVLTTHQLTKLPNDEYERDESVGPIGKQLLLNYCFGHKNSTLLLSPYGGNENLINHNSMNPNVQIQWADHKSFTHNPNWLNLSVDELITKTNAGLAFDYIATRDIQEGEEVFLNYGKEWEDAWNEHVTNWIPPEGMEHYVRASVLNADTTTPLRTEVEQKVNPYPVVELRCRDTFVKYKKDWKKWKNDPRTLQLLSRPTSKRRTSPCKILEREVVVDDDEEVTLYKAEIIKDTPYETVSIKVLEQLPREAFLFFDPPYTSDMYLENAFRHEIMIPDDMFPKAWINR